MTNHISTVSFHGQPLSVIPQDNQLYVAIKPICENIGLPWEGQRQRIKRDEVLNSTASMIQAVASDGKNRKLVCLPVGYLNGWLFGIETNRIKDESVRQRVLEYQRECYQALFSYWQKGYASRSQFQPQQLPLPQRDPLENLCLSGNRNLPDARKLIKEISKHIPTSEMHLVNELDATVVKAWTEVDESLQHVNAVQRYLSRARGNSSDFA